MDNNRFIGFTLIALLIVTYYTLFPPGQVEDYNEPVNKNEKIESIESEPEEKKIKSVGLVAGFENFQADICLSEIGFY